MKWNSRSLDQCTRRVPSRSSATAWILVAATNHTKIDSLTITDSGPLHASSNCPPRQIRKCSPPAGCSRCRYSSRKSASADLFGSDPVHQHPIYCVLRLPHTHLQRSRPGRNFATMRDFISRGDPVQSTTTLPVAATPSLPWPNVKTPAWRPRLACTPVVADQTE